MENASEAGSLQYQFAQRFEDSRGGVYLVMLLLSDVVDRDESGSLELSELPLDRAGADISEVDDLVCVKAPAGIAIQNASTRCWPLVKSASAA